MWFEHSIVFRQSFRKFQTPRFSGNLENSGPMPQDFVHWGLEAAAQTIREVYSAHLSPVVPASLSGCHRAAVSGFPCVRALYHIIHTWEKQPGNFKEVRHKPDLSGLLRGPKYRKKTEELVFHVSGLASDES